MRLPGVAEEPRGRAVVASGGVAVDGDDRLGDLRFRALLSAEWDALPPAVRRRFSRRVAGGKTAVYVGRVTEMRMSRAGWCPRAGRAPDRRSAAARARSRRPGGRRRHRGSRRERAELDPALCASRRLPADHPFRQALRADRTRGIRRLRRRHGAQCEIAPRALVFRSAGYFVQLFGRRIAWPEPLGPGVLTVAHGELDDGAFSFTLDLVHPRVGALIRQTAIFREAGP